jgi:stearoyl-CoA 9-desaturase NADPH oxidoreductase
VSALRRNAMRLARSLTTPLVPDDYLALIDPRWSARELIGTIAEVRPETAEASTVVVRPSFTWPGHRPGQYLRIGVELNGIRHWRAYSLTSDPDHPDGLVSVTVKHVPSGRLSPYFTRRAEPGSLVFLGEVEGEFRLPDSPMERSLFISAGSGVTPIWSMLRELERGDQLSDVVHLHCSRTAEEVIFGDYLRRMDREYPGYTLHERLTGHDGRVAPSDLEDICPDWREREAFLSGPRDMIDAMGAHWRQAGDRARLHIERFQPTIGRGDVALGSGGTVHFRVTDMHASCDPGVSMLVGGEAAGGLLPFGCRMGICHTCVGKLRSGVIRDLRTGDLHGEPGETVRTCVNAPEGHVEVDL